MSAKSKPTTVTFDLAKCDIDELVALREIFNTRYHRTMHLSGAVPQEYVKGLEDEADGYLTEARKIDAVVDAERHTEAARRADLQRRVDERRARDAVARDAVVRSLQPEAPVTG